MRLGTKATNSSVAAPRRRLARRRVSRLLAALLARLASLWGPLPWLRQRLRAGAAGWSLIGVAAGLAPWVSPQAQNLPLPPRAGLPNECTPATCGPNVRFNPVGSVTVNATPNAMTINQATGTAILNWQNFNIAGGHSVTFRQPDANAVALNRIYDPNVSRIDGHLAANGQIYLINPNGLLFGSTARVDVGGLIASTLNVSDERLRAGLLSDPRVALPVFAGGLDGAAANPNGRIEVFSGARIYAAGRDQNGTVVRAGNVFLFAPEINNAGSIQVDAGGQVIFAAGQRVFLTGSNTPTLRGLLVEVGEGGSVSHSGEIRSARGNVTLIGMAVNQAGRISATSALRENGSIRLIARQVGNDGTDPSPIRTPEPTFFLQTGRTGQVTVGSGSRTEVALDRDDRATAPLNDEFAAQARSSIRIEGAQVRIGGDGSPGATLLQARGGDVAVSARTEVSVIGDLAQGRLLGREDAAATIEVGSDVSVDVSGERDVAVDGARNFVSIDRLTSSDLRDAPQQRDGFLRGQRVYVNVAQDHPFIDLSSRREAVAGTQAERNATAGTISLRAEGAVNVGPGAVFDVSGGSTRTSAAAGRTSQLVTENGQVVDITVARADQRYVGFADTFTRNVDAPREGLLSSTRFDSPVTRAVGGFTEGKAAGTVEIIAPRGSFAPQIVAETLPGTGQRTHPPVGGTLRIGGTGDNTDLDRLTEISRANVLIASDALAASAALTPEQRDRLITVDAAMLRRGRVSRIEIVSDGSVKLAADTPLDLGPRGSLSIDANAVEVGASVRAAGGSIRVAERPPSAGDPEGVRRDARNLVAAADRGSVRFGVGVALDVAGSFTNDSLLSPQTTAPIVRDGGRIDISGRRVDLSSVTRMTVDAGASVSRAGTVTGGRAGSLSLRGSETASGLGIVNDRGSLVLGANFEQRISGFGFVAGGSLSLTAPRLQIGGVDTPSAAGETGVATALFDRGFESFALRGTESLRVSMGATVRPVPRLRVDAGAQPLAAAASGTPIADIAPAQVPPLQQQRAVRLSLSSDLPSGVVGIDPGVQIDAGTRGEVSLSAGRQILVDGSLRAAGGSVRMSLGPAPLSGAGATVENFAARAIHLGDSARVDVSGTSTAVTDARGVRRGEVLDGGSVLLNAPLGTVAIAPGASIRAGGAVDALDIGPAGATRRVDVASAGGTVSIAAQQGLFVDGSVEARAGATGAAGGRLSVQLSGLTPDQKATVDLPIALLDSLYRQDRVLTLGGDSDPLPGVGSPFAPAQVAGRARVRSSLINDSGFDQVWLSSSNVIEAPQSQSLAARGSLVLESQVLRTGPDATLSVRAPYVALGLGPRNVQPGPGQDGAASGGTGRLDVDARNVDLVGDLALQGVRQADIRAAEDLRLRGGGAPTAVRPRGSLTVAGDLNLTAAQVFPATQTDFTVRVDAPGGTIRVAGSGHAPLDPLSAAGTVTFIAPNYRQSGRVAAPHGGIRIEAGDSASLSSTAELSVAGNAVVPYGAVYNRSVWSYSNNPAATEPVLASPRGATLPDKRIDITGERVDLAPGARIDIAGGGELLGAEFVEGPGGSTNVSLNFLPNAPGATGMQRNPLFALLPARGASIAPFDPLIMSDLSTNAALGSAASLPFGSTITIGPGGPIPAGTYTILPPRYALLPDAVAVEPVAGFRDLDPARFVREAAGTTIVAGRLGQVDAGTQAGRWSGFRVYTREQFGRLAEFHTYSGSSFFRAAARAAERSAPRVPVDAGALSVAADALRLGPTINSRAAPGGRGTEVALSAPSLTVVAGAAGVPDAPQSNVTLSADSLNSLQAESLILGARAERDAHGNLTLTRGALRVAVDPGAQVRAGEIVLSARETVDVRAGAQLQASGAAAGTRRVDAAGDGAALVVSNADDVAALVRRDASTAGTAVRGDLVIDDSARLEGNSVLFDGTREQRFAPSVALAARNIGLSGAVVNLGEVPLGTAGLNLSNALLAQFASADSFSVRSAGGFNFFGNASIGATDASGAPTLRALTLDGAGLGGQGGSASMATLTAGRISLRNSGGTPAAPAGGQGTLVVNAIAGRGESGTLAIGPGSISVSGFNEVTLRAQGPASGGSPAGGEVQFSGSGRLDVSGAVALEATQVTGSGGAQHGIGATGALRMRSTGAAPAQRPDALGARLAFEGRSVEVSGRIVAPSGEVTLRASGTGSADDVVLRDGAVIDVAGVTQTFGGTRADASAGRIALSSAAGSVRQQAAAQLDLRGAGRDGDAGALAIDAAAGTVELAGSVRTAPGSAARGARIAIDAGRLADLATVTQAISDGGGQAHSVAIRVRRGDAVLGSDRGIDARNIAVAVDGAGSATRPGDGRLRIDGRLDAGGDRGGRVELYARDQVALGSTARIDASAAAAGEEGGSVLISAGVHENSGTRAALDAIVIDPGARVDVGGTAEALNGTVTLRSARVGNDVAIAPLPGDYLRGARREIVEAVVLADLSGNLSLSPTGAVTAANPLPALRTTLSDYMSAANRAAMSARLDRTGSAGFSLRPGLEIRTPGDIAIATAALDFTAGLVAGDTGSSFQWRYGGTTLAASDPGALTLRAGGNIAVSQPLTDGMTGTATGTAPTLRPFAAGDSWRFQLTAGADRQAADPSATTGTTGNVAIGASGAIRTGTGRIDIAAARDILLAAQTSVVFTSGVASVAGPAFASPQVTSLNPQFTRHGGSVKLVAGRDIRSATGSNQLVNEWLWRVGSFDRDTGFAGPTGTPTAWWANIGRFQQGAGALGGGDLTVQAGRDIERLGTAVPTNGFLEAQTDPANPAVITGYVLSERNGGRLDIGAGGRVSGGTHYAQRGEFDIRAEEVIGTTAADQLRIAHGNNAVDVQTRGDARVVAAFNPTWAPQAAAQVLGLGGLARSPLNVAFATFGDDSALAIRSLIGDVRFGGSFSVGHALGDQLSVAPSEPFQIAAPTLDLMSFGGDVAIDGALLMFPGATGQLRMLADRNVGGLQGSIAMSNLDPASLPGVRSPSSTTDLRALFAAPSAGAGGGPLGSFDLATTLRHGRLPQPLHFAGAEPVHVVARQGSIEAQTFDLPKFAHFSAGQNIGNGARMLVQNANADSITRISAGGDIDFSGGGGATDFSIEIRGQGAAEVLAGGAVNLGTGGGIVSRGNLANAFLPAEGASLVVAAGLGRGADGFAQAPDYANALRQFIRYDAFAASAAAAAELNASVLSGDFDPAVRDLLARALADRAAVEDPNSSISRELAALSPLQQQRAAITLVQQVQRVANRRFVDTRNTDTFAPGYAALADLFPHAQDYAQGMRQFVLGNPFAAASNAQALREQVLAALPHAVAELLRAGLADPASVNDPQSAFGRALAGLPADTLAAAGRRLLAASLRVGGMALDELRAAGRVDPGLGTPFARGLTDLAAAYSPAGAVGTHDISLVFTQIKAEQSGDLALFAPRGGVLAGQGNPPAGAVVEKRADQLGILTLAGGDIFGAVRDSFDVFRSRVFTIAGGDIHLWSSTGNINAGRGPRDVAVAPPPRLSIRPDGSVTFDVTASVQGSGIGALRTRADQPPSDIRLIAPRGFIDAGEAGIRADTGTVTLGTNIVLNAGNIAAGGGVAGGAVVVAPVAPVPTSANAGDQANEAVAATQRSAAAQQREAEERAEKERRMRVRGEFLGFGDD